MHTLALRAGACIAVIAQERHDSFCVVTHGRVQLELRDGEPGPVLGRDAAFWFRGTGVLALHNPDRRTARMRVIAPPGSRAVVPADGAVRKPRRSSREDEPGEHVGLDLLQFLRRGRIAELAQVIRLPAPTRASTLATGTRTQ